MGLVLTFVVRMLHDDWSISLGENRPDRALKHLVAMLARICSTSEENFNKRSTRHKTDCYDRPRPTDLLPRVVPHIR